MSHFRLVANDGLTKNQKMYVDRHAERYLAVCENCKCEVDSFACCGFKDYAYKILRPKKCRSSKENYQSKYYIFCSWHCLREFEKENAELMPHKREQLVYHNNIRKEA